MQGVSLIRLPIKERAYKKPVVKKAGLNYLYYLYYLY